MLLLLWLLLLLLLLLLLWLLFLLLLCHALAVILYSFAVVSCQLYVCFILLLLSFFVPSHCSSCRSVRSVPSYWPSSPYFFHVIAFVTCTFGSCDCYSTCDCDLVAVVVIVVALALVLVFFWFLLGKCPCCHTSFL